MNTTQLHLTKEELATKLTSAYNRRIFTIYDLREYTDHLSPAQAFALSRLLPKEIVERLLAERLGSQFADKVIDGHLTISSQGPVKEISLTKALEEVFLTMKGTEIINVLTNR